MRGYTFKVRGDDRVFVLTYLGGTARVLDAGPRCVGMSPVGAARELGRSYTWANGDEEAWGRLVLERRQGGHAPLFGYVTEGEVREWLDTLSDDDFEALLVGCRS